LKIEITKTHVVAVVIVIVLASALGLFLFYRSGNNIDLKLDALARELAIAKADKACKENNVPNEKCKEIKDNVNANSDTSRLELIGNLNKACKDFNYSDEQCREYKETFVKKVRDEIDATKPFSELDS